MERNQGQMTYLLTHCLCPPSRLCVGGEGTGTRVLLVTTLSQLHITYLNNISHMNKPGQSPPHASSLASLSQSSSSEYPGAGSCDTQVPPSSDQFPFPGCGTSGQNTSPPSQFGFTHYKAGKSKSLHMRGYQRSLPGK